MIGRLKQTGLPILLVCISGILLTGCSIGGRKGVDQEEKSTAVSPTAQSTQSPQEAINQRPFVNLTPSSDGHRLTLKMTRIPDTIKSFEYELIYFADFEGNKIERGVDNGNRPVDLTGKTDYTKEFLLGSESCTTGRCKYRYDEGVSEGTLTLKFMFDKGTDKFMTSFRIQNNLTVKDGISSGDGGFLYKTSGKINGMVLTMQTAGLPKKLDCTPKSPAYGIFPAVNKGIVSFNSTATNAFIYGYNGIAWNKLETKVTDGQLVAESSGNFIFILGE